jgi:hypothetical protein
MGKTAAKATTQQPDHRSEGDGRYIELLKMASADGWLSASETAQLDDARVKYSISTRRHYELVVMVVGGYSSFGSYITSRRMRPGLDTYKEMLAMAFAKGMLSHAGHPRMASQKVDRTLREARQKHSITIVEHYAAMAEVMGARTSDSGDRYDKGQSVSHAALCNNPVRASELRDVLLHGVIEQPRTLLQTHPPPHPHRAPQPPRNTTAGKVAIPLLARPAQLPPTEVLPGMIPLAPSLNEGYALLLRNAVSTGKLGVDSALRLAAYRDDHGVSLRTHYELLARLAGLTETEDQCRLERGSGNESGRRCAQVMAYKGLLRRAKAEAWLSWKHGEEDKRLVHARRQYAITARIHYTVMAEVFGEEGSATNTRVLMHPTAYHTAPPLQPLRMPAPCLVSESARQPVPSLLQAVTRAPLRPHSLVQVLRLPEIAPCTSLLGPGALKPAHEECI